MFTLTPGAIAVVVFAEPTPLLTIRREILSSVYWNRHKKCWSIKRPGSRVEHFLSGRAVDVRFHVGIGRQQVVATGKRHVHAWVTLQDILDD